MKALFGLVALGVVILALALAQPLQERLEDSNSYQRQRQALDLAQREYAFQKRQQWDAATAPANTALYYLSGALALVTAYLVVGWLGDARKRRARAFDVAELAGYPVARALLERGDPYTLDLIERALLADKHAAIEAARRPIPPAHLTYSYAPRISGQAAPELEAAPAALASVPTFAELLSRGEIGQGRPLVLGYTAAGEPLRGSWLDLYSTAVGGLPGSGKTTSQRFLAAQSALHGCSFVVVDKHADAADDSLAATLAPLASLYRCEPASTEKAILEAVRLVADIGEKRIMGKDTSRTPVILWVDEATALLAHSRIGDELAALLEQIAQQYRKRAVYASISGQIWTADRAGSSALRDSLASVLAHRMKRNQARLLVPTDEAVLVERLAPGQALLWRTAGQSEVLTIPNTSAADVRQVAGLLTSGAPTMPRVASTVASSVTSQVSNVTSTMAAETVLEGLLEARWKPDGSQMEATSDVASTASGRGGPLSPEAARAAALFLDGCDVAEIVRQLWPNTGAGREYQKRSSEVQALLRMALR